MLSSRGSAPCDEATYNPLSPGLPELSGIQARLTDLVNDLGQPVTPSNIPRQMQQEQQGIADASQSVSGNLVTQQRQAMSVAIPLYIYPGENNWDALHTAIAKHGVNFDLIVNPANGPGGRVPDSNYIREVARLNTYRNCRIFGYVHVSWGTRDLALVREDILTWAHWKDHAQDIHIDAIFVDEAPSNLDKLEYMTKVHEYCKTLMGEEALIWTNPGVPIDDAFCHIADLVNCHENTYEGWKQAPHPSNAKSTAMIHTYPRSAAEMKCDLAVLQQTGYCSVLITTANCYTSFSSFLDQLVKAVEDLNAMSQ